MNWLKFKSLFFKAVDVVYSEEEPPTYCYECKHLDLCKNNWEFSLCLADRRKSLVTGKEEVHSAHCVTRNDGKCKLYEGKDAQANGGAGEYFEDDV